MTDHLFVTSGDITSISKISVTSRIDEQMVRTHIYIKLKQHCEVTFTPPLAFSRKKPDTLVIFRAVYLKGPLSISAVSFEKWKVLQNANFIFSLLDVTRCNYCKSDKNVFWSTFFSDDTFNGIVFNCQNLTPTHKKQRR